MSILSELSNAVWQIFLLTGTQVYKMPCTVHGEEGVWVLGCVLGVQTAEWVRAFGDLWSYGGELQLCWFFGYPRGCMLG